MKENSKEYYKEFYHIGNSEHNITQKTELDYVKASLKEYVISLDADVCGVANIDRFGGAPKGFHPTDIYTECKSVIVFGIALPKGLTMVEPRLIYGHFNYDICKTVDLISFRTAKVIEEKYHGIAVPMPCDGPYEYWDSERKEGRGLISMKHSAVLAGLGNLGKSTLLLNEKYGNLLILGAILTNLDMPSDPLSKSICIENCRLCIDNCPSKALNGTTVNQFNCRTNTYNKNSRGYDTVDCNRCRTVCPMRYGKE
jgi:epoxyqueuosine reductase QueG